MSTQVPVPDPVDPYPWFAHMRADSPVWQEPASGVWYVFGYADVLRVLNPPVRPTAEDPVRFSSQLPPAPYRAPTGSSIIMSDPPRQRVVRELLAPAFTPGVLRHRYTDLITSVVDAVLDEVVADGGMDVVADLSYRVPIAVITDLLAVPAAHADVFQGWAARVVEEATAADGESQVHLPALADFFTSVIEQRRGHGGEDGDVLSRLVRGTPSDGVPLGDDELLGNAELLLLAGLETTAHLLTNIFRVWCDVPGVQERVWRDPAVVPAMVEETLRYLSPVHVQTRRTTTDVELGGRRIAAHSPMVTLLSSANRDGAVFPRPDEFDLDRYARAAPNHVAFGLRGTHFCLGAPLARLGATITVRRIIDRITGINAVPGVVRQAPPLSFAAVPLVNGLRGLPVTFQPR